jgi:hypothetical protein
VFDPPLALSRRLTLDPRTETKMMMPPMLLSSRPNGSRIQLQHLWACLPVEVDPELPWALLQALTMLLQLPSQLPMSVIRRSSPTKLTELLSPTVLVFVSIPAGGSGGATALGQSAIKFELDDFNTATLPTREIPPPVVEQENCRSQAAFGRSLSSVRHSSSCRSLRIIL